MLDMRSAKKKKKLFPTAKPPYLQATSSKVSTYHGNGEAFVLPHLRRHCLKICTKKPRNWALQSFFIKAYWPCWSCGHQQVSFQVPLPGTWPSLLLVPPEVPGPALVWCLSPGFLKVRPLRQTSSLIRSCLALSHYYRVSPSGGSTAGNPRRRLWGKGSDNGVLGCTLMGLHKLQFSKNLTAF